MAKHLNYLLFVPSLLSRTQSLVYQTAVEDLGDAVYPDYSGLQTNEAVTKFLIDYLHNANEKLDKIIMLCTKEVLKNQLEQIGSQTTCEYYKEEIKKFIRERDYTEMPETDQLFEIVPYFPQNNENENQIITKLEEIVKPEDRSEYRKRLFVDFTGGNRSSALTMVFACRILDQSGVEMGKILYSNLRKDMGIIEECTQTYKIFSAFERKLLIDNDIFIKEDIQSEGKPEEQSVLDVVREEMLRAQNLNQHEDVKKTAEEISNLSQKIDTTNMSHTDKANVKAMEKKANETLEENEDLLLKIQKRLKKRNYNQALNLFRENIIQILYTSGIIDINDRYKKNQNFGLVADEIAAVYNYYEGDIKNPTFLQTVKNYMQLLCDNPESSPSNIKENYFGEEFFQLQTYKDQIPTRGFKHTLYSKRKSDQKVIPYVESLYEEGLDFRECIHQYSDMDRLYMGYGFPFACTYGGVKYFHGYDSLYWRIFKNGVKSLQKFFEGKEEKRISGILESFSPENRTYEKVIRALCTKQHEEELRILFPFQILPADIRSEILDAAAWRKFIYSFAYSYCIIKKVRNGAIHIKDLEKGDIKQAFEELEKVLGQIEDIRDRINCKQ